MHFKHLCLLISLCSVSSLNAQENKNRVQQTYFLIAHRGGVVDSTKAENSLPALKAAIERGYTMVEIDLRLTKDRVLIIHHDTNFKRYFGVDKKVSDMNWKEISKLKSNTGGSRVLTFEAALQYCSGKIAVMIDNKISGNDTVLFSKVIALLKKYKLDKAALMIGTDESTGFFTGKIKLSCTRKQLEENMLKPGYSPLHYYLFGNEITRDDVEWAKRNTILAVGVVNAWRYRRFADPLAEAEKDAQRLKATGLNYFQIDSEFERFFR
ncbi:glycerophosphodiester phosphodiesterase family protein [Agriterribacter sp.]|uniref:glycerophosphodiester phosphodiesterase n=1 Tax=Agriterribacter sp. TaxID=2821509 RepID=UPI002B66438E|nr:glycerophosphodiester phosphodiesterase family protein [Agriterribacter sp.]HTN05906.1 glycerophosphodiester phosphodiesterase family protein [Agriterribacter sp.]